jgi:hypothetical protein
VKRWGFLLKRSLAWLMRLITYAFYLPSHDNLHPRYVKDSTFSSRLLPSDAQCLLTTRILVFSLKMFKL